MLTHNDGVSSRLWRQALHLTWASHFEVQRDGAQSVVKSHSATRAEVF